MAAKSLPETTAKDIVADWRTGEFSQQELLPMGICYNCGDPVGLGERFCRGPDCRDDYTARKQAEIRRGRTQ